MSDKKEKTGCVIIEHDFSRHPAKIAPLNTGSNEYTAADNSEEPHAEWMAQSNAEERAEEEATDQRVTGYLRTHIDCPVCESVFDVEGDASDETVACPDCETNFYVEGVR